MNQKKILLVDDDLMSVEFMKLYLESNGFFVSCAYSFHEAVQSLLKEAFAFLITDIQLSDGSGIELAKQARADNQNLENDTNPVIIGVTGFSKEDIKTDLFDFILTKPVDLSKLSAVLK